jgi:glyoxylase-like metal-dependent hydrolase (beta-lactamase superfamily II)
MNHNDDHAAAPPWDASSVNLTSKELAPSVFAVLPDDVFDEDHVATTAGFVIGERAVLVIESMLNGDLASQLIGLVRQATIKPIHFLVNTSYHGDHAYGNYVSLKVQSSFNIPRPRDTWTSTLKMIVAS